MTRISQPHLSATFFHAEITANVDAFYAGTKGYPEFSLDNKAIWDRAQASGVMGLVQELIRRDEAVRS